MTCTFEWAAYPCLLERSFFEWTKELYNLEKVLQTPIPDSMHWTRRFEYPWILSKIIDSPPPRRFLDAGAGATALQFALAKRGDHVTAIDPDKTAIEWINARRRAWGMKPNATVGGFPILPFADGEFDTGICISVLEHLPKDQVLPSVRELMRVSRKEVLITMDIALEHTEKQLDIHNLVILEQELMLRRTALPANALTFHIDGGNFAVACIHVIKD